MYTWHLVAHYDRKVQCYGQSPFVVMESCSVSVWSGGNARTQAGEQGVSRGREGAWTMPQAIERFEKTIDTGVGVESLSVNLGDS